MFFNEFPPEIIQRVFRLCCGRVTFIIPPPNEIQEGEIPPWRMNALILPNETRRGATQVILSLICSRWREIALDTRSLWNNVMVYYDACRDPVQDPTASFQFVHNWLNRAGMTPISLSISVFGAEKPKIAAISQTLLSSFHITNLGLVSSQCDYPLIPPNNSHYLERLGLYVDDMMWPIDAFPSLPEMPSLKELRLGLDLGSESFRDLTNFYLIPWHQLRVFAVRHYPWSSQMTLDILQQCKSLVDCALLVNLHEQPQEHDIVLPNLESLVVEISSGNADSIIRSFTVPNLRSLHIKFWIFDSYQKLPLSTEAIVIMAQRSEFKRLTDFSLCMTEQPADVMSLLGSMPALERARFHGRLIFQPGTFDDLSSGTIGPRLEEIYFGDMSNEEIGCMLETVGRRHKKAKIVSDIRPFASVTCSASGSDFKSLNQRAKECGEAFNTHLEIRRVNQTEESGSNPGIMFVPDEEPLENAGEESYSFEYSGSESSDHDVGLHSGEGSDT